MLDAITEVNLSGGRPSPRARRAEEHAFEELDCARHALFTVASAAFPMIH